MRFRCLFNAECVELLEQFEYFLEKTFFVKLVSVASVTNRLRILPSGFMSLEGITSVPLPIFISRFFNFNNGFAVKFFSINYIRSSHHLFGCYGDPWIQ